MQSMKGALGIRTVSAYYVRQENDHERDTINHSSSPGSDRKRNALRGGKSHQPDKLDQGSFVPDPGETFVENAPIVSRLSGTLSQEIGREDYKKHLDEKFD